MLADAHSDGTRLRIIDELACLLFEANAAHLFFQLVSRRYEKRSILIT
jgi:DNA replication protein DnaC